MTAVLDYHECSFMHAGVPVDRQKLTAKDCWKGTLKDEDSLVAVKEGAKVGWGFYCQVSLSPPPGLPPSKHTRMIALTKKTPSPRLFNTYGEQMALMGTSVGIPESSGTKEVTTTILTPILLFL
jgi:hypothetical protein